MSIPFDTGENVETRRVSVIPKFARLSIAAPDEPLVWEAKTYGMPKTPVRLGPEVTIKSVVNQIQRPDVEFFRDRLPRNVLSRTHQGGFWESGFRHGCSDFEADRESANEALKLLLT